MTGAGPFPTSTARRITVQLSGRDQVRHRALVVQLLHDAHQTGVAGATVFRGQEGYGTSGRLHTTHLLSDDAPLSLVIIDSPERIDSFLAAHADLLKQVAVVADDVEVVHL